MYYFFFTVWWSGSKFYITIYPFKYTQNHRERQMLSAFHSEQCCFLTGFWMYLNSATLVTLQWICRMPLSVLGLVLLCYSLVLRQVLVSIGRQGFQIIQNSGSGLGILALPPAICNLAELLSPRSLVLLCFPDINRNIHLMETSVGT